jgi:phosphatidylserine/phosphatidylglycerophosphate/cardiolipin synthase-like enzyme
MQTIIGKQFPQKVIPLIDEAKRSIDIIVFDWRWYPDDPGNPVQLFNQAIVRAVRRGVQVRAIINNDDITATLKSVGVNAKRFISQKLIHGKTMIIDGEIAIVGSHNYTQYAFTMNYEVSVLVEGREEIAKLTEFFNNLYS